MFFGNITDSYKNQIYYLKSNYTKKEFKQQNATLTNSGEHHVFSPNGCCLKPHEQHHIPEFILQHKDDKNNGNDFGRYKINITKATCFMNLEKDS